MGVLIGGFWLKIWCHPPVTKDAKITIVNNIKILAKAWVWGEFGATLQERQNGLILKNEVASFLRRLKIWCHPTGTDERAATARQVS